MNSQRNAGDLTVGTGDAMSEDAGGGVGEVRMIIGYICCLDCSIINICDPLY